MHRTRRGQAQQTQEGSVASRLGSRGQQIEVPDAVLVRLPNMLDQAIEELLDGNVGLVDPIVFDALFGVFKFFSANSGFFPRTLSLNLGESRLGLLCCLDGTLEV